MRTIFCSLLALAFIASACKKKTPQPTASVPGAETNVPQAVAEENGTPDSDTAATLPAQPLPPPPPPTREVVARAVNTLRQNVVGEVDAQLTAELKNFVQQKKRMPQSFSEFATLRLDSIPRPPAGKKWVIDAETLEVKAVSSQ